MLNKRETERGQLGGPVKHSEGKGEESDVAILRFLCGSPHQCRLRIEGLVPVSKYWTYRSHAGDMGLVSLVTCHRQKPGLSLLLHWLVSKRNWVRTRWSVSRHAVDCVGSLFLKSSGIHPNLSVTRERLPRTGTAYRKHTSDVCGLVCEAYVPCWSGFPLQGVHQFESPRLLDMSNHLFVAAIK
jgi:hypothetical protein